MSSATGDSNKAFVDTNVFLYAEDLRDPARRAIATELIERLMDENRLMVSSQVLNELCAVLLRGKLGARTTQADLTALVDEICASAEVVPITPDTTREALRASFVHQLSWYDALIWSAARQGGCSILYTEDLGAASQIEGVRYVNPFQAEGISGL